jgi:hypothetical protein
MGWGNNRAITTFKICIAIESKENIKSELDWECGTIEQ